MLRSFTMPHANRSKRADAPARNPHADEVRAARAAAGLTQTDAARAVFVTLSAWQRWEDEGDDSRRMPAAAWWLFRLRTGQATLADLPPLDQRG